MALKLFIPSSRLVSVELQLEVGRVPPCMIPLRGKPLLEHLCELYPAVDQVYVGTNEGRDIIEDWLASSSWKQKVTLIPVGIHGSLGLAVRDALTQLHFQPEDRLIINFGDTIIRDAAPSGKDMVSYASLRESLRWTSFSHRDGRICLIQDKGETDDAAQRAVFTGMFQFSDPGRFLSSLSTQESDGKLDIFYIALQEYLRASTVVDLVETKAWLDFGHVDTYHYAKRRFVNARHFNQIDVDDDRPVLLKRSSNQEKLVGEIRWYQELPSALRCYLPQIFESSVQGSQPFVKMEYYGYPALSELFVFGGYDIGIWTYALDKIFLALHEFRQFQYQATTEVLTTAIHSMYVQKTLDRCMSLQEHEIMGKLVREGFRLNGKPQPPLSVVLAALPELVHSSIALPSGLSIIHGDLCLSNILYDPRSRIIKLIDPRGSFGETGIYGDPRYDLAKLCHSFCGFYDLLQHDRFTCLVDDHDVSFSVRSTPYHYQVGTLFLSRLRNEFGAEELAVRLIEALLFLSMIPLHADKPHRQLAMYCTAIDRLDSLMLHQGKSLCGL